MSSNGTTLQDEDGDTPDWIEIYNPGPASVDLGGFGLSDDSTDLFRWTFPPHLLSPQNHLLV
ncbi:MAG: lamin tail domain-containing protein, partial [Calditrichaeota bacterium]|nr:lamin tail domain-containing protein [Calditrichota bacterium]